MITVFLADGFEEIEALATVDILRRAGLCVQTVGVMGKVSMGSHQIPVILSGGNGDGHSARRKSGNGPSGSE